MRTVQSNTMGKKKNSDWVDAVWQNYIPAKPQHRCRLSHFPIKSVWRQIECLNKSPALWTMWVNLAHTVKAAGHTAWCPGQSGLTHRVVSKCGRLRPQLPFPPPSSLPPLPPCLAYRQLKCLFCLVALLHRHTCTQIGERGGGIQTQVWSGWSEDVRTLPFEGCQTGGFIMYHPLNSISFINTLFHRCWASLRTPELFQRCTLLGSVLLMSVKFAQPIRKGTFVSASNYQRRFFHSCSYLFYVPFWPLLLTSPKTESLCCL